MLRVISFGDLDSLEGNVISLIEKLQWCIEKTPEEYRDSLQLEFLINGSYGSDFSIFYFRADTKEEKDLAEGKRKLAIIKERARLTEQLKRLDLQ